MVWLWGNKTRVADPNHFNADRILIQLLKLMRFRIRILLLIKVMGNLRPLVYRPSASRPPFMSLQLTILGLQASNPSIHGFIMNL
jgi:hypothetical protein